MNFSEGDPQQPYVLIIHEVDDYEKWKAAFDDAAVIRREAGEIAYQMLAYDTDARHVVHFSQWTSLNAARAFFEYPQVVGIRRVAGVRAPEFRYLNQIEARTL